jgi:hypothetical protein
MATDTRKRIRDPLRQMRRQGLPAAKQLFWTERNYDRTNRPLSRRNWPEPARQALSAVQGGRCLVPWRCKAPEGF